MAAENRRTSGGASALPDDSPELLQTPEVTSSSLDEASRSPGMWTYVSLDQDDILSSIGNITNGVNSGNPSTPRTISHEPRFNDVIDAVATHPTSGDASEEASGPSQRFSSDGDGARVSASDYVALSSGDGQEEGAQGQAQGALATEQTSGRDVTQGKSRDYTTLTSGHGGEDAHEQMQGALATNQTSGGDVIQGSSRDTTTNSGDDREDAQGRMQAALATNQTSGSDVIQGSSRDCTGLLSADDKKVILDVNRQTPGIPFVTESPLSSDINRKTPGIPFVTETPLSSDVNRQTPGIPFVTETLLNSDVNRNSPGTPFVPAAARSVFREPELREAKISGDYPEYIDDEELRVFPRTTREVQVYQTGYHTDVCNQKLRKELGIKTRKCSGSFECKTCGASFLPPARQLKKSYDGSTCCFVNGCDGVLHATSCDVIYYFFTPPFGPCSHLTYVKARRQHCHQRPLGGRIPPATWRAALNNFRLKVERKSGNSSHIQSREQAKRLLRKAKIPLISSSQSVEQAEPLLNKARSESEPNCGPSSNYPYFGSPDQAKPLPARSVGLDAASLNANHTTRQHLPETLDNKVPDASFASSDFLTLSAQPRNNGPNPINAAFRYEASPGNVVPHTRPQGFQTQLVPQSSHPVPPPTPIITYYQERPKMNTRQGLVAQCPSLPPQSPLLRSQDFSSAHGDTFHSEAINPGFDPRVYCMPPGDNRSFPCYGQSYQQARSTSRYQGSDTPRVPRGAMSSASYHAMPANSLAVPDDNPNTCTDVPRGPHRAMSSASYHAMPANSRAVPDSRHALEQVQNYPPYHSHAGSLREIYGHQPDLVGGHTPEYVGGR